MGIAGLQKYILGPNSIAQQIEYEKEIEIWRLYVLLLFIFL